MSPDPLPALTAAERLTSLLKALDRMVEDDRDAEFEHEEKADRRISGELRDRSRDAFELSLRKLVEECERLQRDSIRLDRLEAFARRNLVTEEGTFENSSVLDATHYVDDKDGVIEFVAMGPQMNPSAIGGSYYTGSAPTLREAIDKAITRESEGAALSHPIGSGDPEITNG